MKKYLFAALVAVAALSFTSCEKCVKCSYELDGVTYDSAELCGKKSEVEALEDEFKVLADSAAAILDTTVTVTCVDQ